MSKLFFTLFKNHLFRYSGYLTSKICGILLTNLLIMEVTASIPPPSSLVYKYQSLPGATAVIYLDFDGEIVNQVHGSCPVPIAAIPLNYSEADITQSWNITSELFRPFNINVTTDRDVYEAASFSSRQHCVFTSNDCAKPGAAGASTIGIFGTNKVCWVYTEGGLSGQIAVHELGHSLGLSHDGDIFTPGPEDYYGSGGIWGPVMGEASGYMFQWSKGEYPNADNLQEDVGIIAANTNVGFRTDEPLLRDLTITSNGTITNTNIGVISTNYDTDIFRFSTSGGSVNIQVDPFKPDQYCITLDVKIVVLNSCGEVVAIDNPINNPSASISINLPAGIYTLVIDGDGNIDPLDNSNNYTDYGSLGLYFVSGTIPITPMACTPTSLVNNYGTNNNYTDLNTYPRMMIDINNDHKADIVAFKTNGVIVSLTNSIDNTFSSPTTALSYFGTIHGFTNQEEYPRILSNVDGDPDNLPDIIGFGPAGVYVSINKTTAPGTFKTAVLWSSLYCSPTWPNQTTYPRFLADVDDDGDADIIAFSANGVVVSKSNGSLFQAPTTYSTSFCNNTGWTDNTIYPRQVIDMNGDNRADVVGFSGGGVLVAINNNAGSFVINSNYTISHFGVNQGYTNTSTHPRYLANMDGDQYPDIVGMGLNNIYVASNNGSGLSTVSSWLYGFGKNTETDNLNTGYSNNNTNPRLLGDIDGNGLDDVVGFNDDWVAISFNNTGTDLDCPGYHYTNSYYTNNGLWSSQSVYPRFLADIDYDGRKEIVGLSSSAAIATNCSITSTGYFKKAATQDIAEINNVVGQVVLKCYPNPSNTVVNFEIRETDKPVSLIIYDVFGIEIKKISEQDLNNQTYTLNVENFSNGIYSYKMLLEGIVDKTGKFVILK